MISQSSRPSAFFLLRKKSRFCLGILVIFRWTDLVGKRHLSPEEPEKQRTRPENRDCLESDRNDTPFCSQANQSRSAAKCNPLPDQYPQPYVRNQVASG